MGIWPHTKFQRNPSSHFRDTEKGQICTCARVHVQMYPIHGLCNMHRGLVSNHTTNLVTISQSIPELQLRGQFLHPLTSHVPQWLPRWMGVGSIHGKRDVATHQRRSFVKSVVVSCRAVPCRSYSDFSLNPRPSSVFRHLPRVQEGGGGWCDPPLAFRN